MNPEKIREIVELSKMSKKEILKKMIEKNKLKVFSIYSGGALKGVYSQINKKNKEDLITEFLTLEPINNPESNKNNDIQKPESETNTKTDQKSTQK